MTTFDKTVFNSSGTVEARNGTLKLLLGNGTGSGRFDAAGGILEFADDYVLDASSQVVGTGTVQFSGSGTTTTVSGSYDVGGTTRLYSSGSVQFNVDATTGTVLHESGTLATVPGTGLTVTGGMVWSAGTKTGAGTIVIDSNASLTLQSGSGKYLNGGTIENYGTASWTAGYIYGNYGATFANQTGATFSIDHSSNIGFKYQGYGSPSVFTNTGLLIKQGGTGVTTFNNTAFANIGTIRVSSGRTLALYGGSFANFASGTMTGGTYDIAGTFKFPNASITSNEAAIILDGAGSQIVNQSNADGLTNFTANGTNGSFAIQNGRNFTTSGPFSNAGSMAVNSGSLFSASGNYTQSGGSTTLSSGTLAANATVDIQGGTLGGSGTIDADLVNAGQVGPGVSPGGLAVTGDYTQAAAGQLAIEMGGLAPVTEHDRLDITGSATLDGTLALSRLNGFLPADDHTFTVMTYGAHSGDFAALTGADLGNDRTFLTNLNANDLILTVGNANQSPVAEDDAYSTAEDEALTITAQGVLNNDAGTSGNPLTAILASDPSSGTLVLNSDGSFTYTPNADFNGTDSFTYQASDGTLQSEAATVTLTVNPVNDAPVATDDAATADEDSPVTIAVLDNDTDVDGDALTVTALTQGTNGSVVLETDHTVTYTPNADFNGTDSFTYQASDGTAQSTAVTVTLTVNPVNDAPVATDDAATTDEDSPVTIAVLDNDTDIDGDALTVTALTQGTNGSVILETDHTVTYTPNADFNGTDTFTYQTSDGTVQSNTVRRRKQIKVSSICDC